MNPRVSVVIPTYNRVADLTRALASLRAQTETNWEAVIVDNHSTDGTRERVEGLRDPRLRLIPVHNDGIIALSRNLGIREAQGEYVAFLDSDDWWSPTKLARSIARLDGGADLVYHDLYLVTQADQARFRKRARTRRLSAPVFRDLLENANGLATSSVVVRRELLRRAGGFTLEREWIGWEDYDLWLGIAKLTDRFERLDETLGYYWFGGGNVSTPRRLLINLGAFRAKYVEREGAPLPGLPGWYHYLMGRGEYSLGEHAAVPGHMRRALAAGLPGLLKLKAAFLATASVFR